MKGQLLVLVVVTTASLLAYWQANELRMNEHIGNDSTGIYHSDNLSVQMDVPAKLSNPSSPGTQHDNKCPPETTDAKKVTDLF